MTINEVVEVVIDSTGGYKFIVAEVTDGVTKRLVVRAQENCSYHRDILDVLRMDLRANRMTARCIGGGHIAIDPVAMTINIWSSSGDFGVEPDRADTVRMLQAAYPEWKVTGKSGGY